jgi:hypothetical protein
MNLENISTRFDSFLNQHWKLSNITPFMRAYVQLLLLFADELSAVELNVVNERKKQLRGEEFDNKDFDALRLSSRQTMAQDDKENTITRRAMLNKLLFCALVDTEETDLFYLTEPMFEFMREMKVRPNEAIKILESEFISFKV